MSTWSFGDMEVEQLHDYIDGEGDMLALDEVDGLLAASVIRRGKTSALTCVITEPAEARKLAKHMLDWADRRDNL